MIYEKQRLPLLCIGLYWFKNCKNFLVLAFLLVFKLFNDAPSFPMILGGILLFLLVCLIFAVLSYARFTFQIDQTSVLVNKGLFIQKQTILPFERIQTIQENHYFYLRPFKLAEVKLESAASSSGEAEIFSLHCRWLSLPPSKRQKRRLRHHNSRMPKQLVEKNQPTITLRFQLRSQPSRR